MLGEIQAVGLLRLCYTQPHQRVDDLEDNQRGDGGQYPGYGGRDNLVAKELAPAIDQSERGRDPLAVDRIDSVGANNR